MFFSKTTLLLALLPLSIAATCDSSSALAYPPSSGNSDAQNAIDNALATCSSGCKLDGACNLGCLQTACASHCSTRSSSSCQTTCLSDVCSAFYGSGSDQPNPDALRACYKAQGIDTRRKRATFTCSSSQTCYMEANGNLFCLNESSGEYDDIVGGHGNVNSGAYTSAVDVVKSSTSAPTRTSTSVGANASSSSSSSRAGTNAAATNAATSATGAAASTPSATGNAAVEKIHANVVVGAMGLVLGLVL